MDPRAVPGIDPSLPGVRLRPDLRTYPGLDKAAPAYGLTPERLEARLGELNPIERVEGLARRRVPALFIHGDQDKVVPLEKNSAEVATRYRTLGGKMELVVVPGKGHEEVDEFFTSERFATFLTTGK